MKQPSRFDTQIAYTMYCSTCKGMTGHNSLSTWFRVTYLVIGWLDKVKPNHVFA